MRSWLWAMAGTAALLVFVWAITPEDRPPAFGSAWRRAKGGRR